MVDLPARQLVLHLVVNGGHVLAQETHLGEVVPVAFPHVIVEVVEPGVGVDRSHHARCSALRTSRFRRCSTPRCIDVRPHVAEPAFRVKLVSAYEATVLLASRE